LFASSTAPLFFLALPLGFALDLFTHLMFALFVAATLLGFATATIIVL